MNNKKGINAVCSNCGAQISVDTQKETVSCHYCGTRFSTADLLNESDVVRVEKIKSQTYKDVEMGKMQVERERMSQMMETEKVRHEEEMINQFKKGKFSKVLLIFVAICMLSCFMAFSKVRILPGIIALVQTVLFVLSWLMGMHIVKEKKKGIYILVAVVGFLLIILYFRFNSMSMNTNRATKFKWADLELCEILPEPESNIGEIHTDFGDVLMIDIHKISEKQYNSYITACKKKGFSVDGDKTSISYSAYNEDGYKLKLFYSDSSKEMSITVNAPMEMAEFEWPDSDIAKLLPIPKSNMGSISWERSNEFMVYVGETTKADYNAYVKECMECGFNVDYDKGDTYYYAENTEGYQLSLSYEGGNIMRISIEMLQKETTQKESDRPEESIEKEVNENIPDEIKDEEDKNTPVENPDTSTGGIRPEFKETLDSYERFFDEYIAFMEKYANSDNAIGMLTDYLDYMERYVEMMEKLDALDDGELSTEETLYYVEVQTRITQKLAAVAQ